MTSQLSLLKRFTSFQKSLRAVDPATAGSFPEQSQHKIDTSVATHQILVCDELPEDRKELTSFLTQYIQDHHLSDLGMGIVSMKINVNAKMRGTGESLAHTVLQLTDQSEAWKSQVLCCFLVDGLDVNVRNTEGRTVCMDACVRRYKSVVKAITIYSDTLDYNCVDDDGCTLLHYLVHLDSVSCMTSFLKAYRNRIHQLQRAQSKKLTSAQTGSEYFQALSVIDLYETTDCHDETPQMLAERLNKDKMLVIIDKEHHCRTKSLTRRLQAIKHQSMPRSFSVSSLLSMRKSSSTARSESDYARFDSLSLLNSGSAHDQGQGDNLASMSASTVSLINIPKMSMTSNNTRKHSGAPAMTKGPGPAENKKNVELLDVSLNFGLHECSSSATTIKQQLKQKQKMARKYSEHATAHKPIVVGRERQESSSLNSSLAQKAFFDQKKLPNINQ